MSVANFDEGGRRWGQTGVSVDPVCVGIVANPASGRDIRRLVAQASVFPLEEKCNMVACLLSGLSAGGVCDVWMMPDLGGIASRVRRLLKNRKKSASGWPRLTFLDMPVQDGPSDTLLATERMVAAGVRAIVVLGGDGTHRLVAQASADVPVTALSTGTNNVFPSIREATTAGLATALVATGKMAPDEATESNKILRISVNGSHQEIALVDVCVSTTLWIGSRALWSTEGLDQLFVTFAQADAIGLSSIAASVRPVSRRAGHGLRLDLASLEEAAFRVRATIGPGLIRPVGVAGVHEMRPGERHLVRAVRGVIALDGEREIEFREGDRVEIQLEEEGPRTIDVERVLRQAARRGFLAEPPGSVEGSREHGSGG